MFARRFGQARTVIGDLDHHEPAVLRRRLLARRQRNPVGPGLDGVLAEVVEHPEQLIPVGVNIDIGEPEIGRKIDDFQMLR